MFGDDRYLQLARQAAELVWRRGLLRKGYGLCHGAAGNGYTFLHVFQLTGVRPSPLAASVCPGTVD